MKINYLCLTYYIAILQLCSCAPVLREIYCEGSKDPVFVYKNPHQAFPSTVKDFKLELKGTSSNLSQLLSPEFNLNSLVERKVVNLREKLNQYNILIENQIKAAFIGYCLRPCDRNVSEKYFDYLDKLSEESIALEKLKLGIDKAINNSGFDPTTNVFIKSVLEKYEENSSLYNTY